MTRQEAIDRWAKFIVPSVFRAETELLQTHPEWKIRLEETKDADYETVRKVSTDYARAIAEIIVSRTSDEELAEMNN